MGEVASAFVSLMPSARGFGKATEKQVGGEVKTAGSSLGKTLGKTMFTTAAAFGAAVGIKSLFSDSIAEAREAQKVGALTENVIRTTGGAAKVTAKQVGKLSTAISNKVGIDDEAIQSGANLLLTFKNVRNEVGRGNKIFDRATQAAVDLSASGFGDLSGASKQLGKALNDPIKGIAALGRAGVTFTQQQKDQIKALVESGNTLKAQKIILKEVESQVGGAAAAQATAGDKAKVALGNLKESIGTAFLPAVDAFSNAFTDKIAPALTNFVENIGPAAGKVKDFFTKGAGAEAFSTTMDAIATAAGKIRDGFKGAADKVGEFGTKLGSLDFSNLDGKDLGQTLATALLAAFSSLGKLAGKIGDKLTDFFSKVDWIGLGIKVGTLAIPFVLGLATGIINGVGDPNLWKGIWDHLPEILLAGLAIALAPTKLIGPIARVLSRIPFIGSFLSASLKWVNGLGGPMRRFATDLFETFTRAFGAAFHLPTGTIIGRITAAISRASGAARGLLSSLGTRLGVWALDAFQFIGRAAGRAGTFIIGRVAKIPGIILRALGDLGGILFGAGKSIIDGLLRGIASAAKGIGGFIKSTVTDHIPGAVKKFLGINSPAKVMIPLGAGVVEGLAVGMQKTGPVTSALADVSSHISSTRFAPGPFANFAPTGAGSATGAASAPAAVRLVVGAREFVAYMEEVADSRVDAYAADSGMVERAFG